MGQADTADCTATGAGASGKFDDFTASRRGLFGLATAGAVAAMVPMIAVAAPSPLTVAWSEAWLDYKAAALKFDVTNDVFDQVEAKYFAQRVPSPAGLPLKANGEVSWKVYRERQANCEARDAALRAELRYDMLEAAKERACEGLANAEVAMLRTPAPSLREVIAKVEVAMTGGVEEIAMTAILADLRRLAAEARA